MIVFACIGWFCIVATVICQNMPISALERHVGLAQSQHVDIAMVKSDLFLPPQIRSPCRNGMCGGVSYNEIMLHYKGLLNVIFYTFYLSIISLYPSIHLYLFINMNAIIFFSFVWVNKECHYFLQVYSLLKQNFKIIHSKNKTNQPPGRHGSMLKMYQIRILEFG